MLGFFTLFSRLGLLVTGLVLSSVSYYYNKSQENNYETDERVLFGQVATVTLMVGGIYGFMSNNPLILGSGVVIQFLVYRNIYPTNPEVNKLCKDYVTVIYTYSEKIIKYTKKKLLEYLIDE